MKVTDFYTVPKSEAGIKVPLLKADGTDSSEWLLIIGPDSKRFAKAVAELNRGLASLRQPPQSNGSGPPTDDAADAELREALADELLVDYVEKLVIGWSFDDEFTSAALRALLENSPAIKLAIPNVTTDRSRFFGLDSPASTPGPTSKDESGARFVTGLEPLHGRKRA
jgi:hypothetical protein